eukprot:m.194135 g.194135  ORF g.194135 m.194135 type:complete len:103 (+) comp16787_c7_seq1:274-582(+)
MAENIYRQIENGLEQEDNFSDLQAIARECQLGNEFSDAGRTGVALVNILKDNKDQTGNPWLSPSHAMDGLRDAIKDAVPKHKLVSLFEKYNETFNKSKGQQF